MADVDDLAGMASMLLYYARNPPAKNVLLDSGWHPDVKNWLDKEYEDIAEEKLRAVAFFKDILDKVKLSEDDVWAIGKALHAHQALWEESKMTPEELDRRNKDEELRRQDEENKRIRLSVEKVLETFRRQAKTKSSKKRKAENRLQGPANFRYMAHPSIREGEEVAYLTDLLNDQDHKLNDEDRVLVSDQVDAHKAYWAEESKRREEMERESREQKERAEGRSKEEQERQSPYIKAIEEQGQEQLLGLVQNVSGLLDNSYGTEYGGMQRKMWKLREDWWCYISVVYNLNRVVLYLLERDHDDLCSQGIRDVDRVRRARKEAESRGIYSYRNEIEATKGLLPLMSEDELPKDIFRGGSYDKHVLDCCRFSKAGVWVMQLNIKGWLMKIGGETSLSFPVNESIWHVPEQGLRKCIKFLRDIGRVVRDGELDNEIREWYAPRYKNNMEMRDARINRGENWFTC